jgi:hypothetical protein
MQNTFNFYYYCANFVNITAFIVHGGVQALYIRQWGLVCSVCSADRYVFGMQMVSVFVEHADGFCFVEHADGFCFTQLHFARHRRLLLQDRSLRHLWKMYFPSTFYIEGNLPINLGFF